ncbi:hypothetical protein KSK55_12120 [Methanospirillum purgamenti]|jgi:hypothetical protein|uniref:IPT/TIG domain-containing protein n=1 Tax=Methanospirillum hungatei TaxID=2203 RepID=A0A8F5VM75_METHU|nr:hypothetical protein [Methanospirillum hungatei]QXO94072.1 hypothetical protein KSK55_12120 [Methanospirillum hungatei]
MLSEYIYDKKILFHSGMWQFFCFFCCILTIVPGSVLAASDVFEIPSLTPDTGYAGYSYLVSITGNNLSENHSVGFSLDDSVLNTTNLTRTDSALTFRIIIPFDAKPGLYQMSIASPDGTVERYNQVFHVQPPAAPKIENISPSVGMAGTLVPVQISGAYFRSGGQIFLNYGDQQVNLTNQSVTYDTIDGTFLLPVSAKPGVWNLSVINPDGQYNDHTVAFTVTSLPSPQIIAITPDQGDMDTSVLVAITGSNFLQGASFTLSRKDLTVSGTDVRVDNSRRIVGSVQIPGKYHDGLWDLSVTNPDGQSSHMMNAYMSGEPYAPFSLHIAPLWGIQGTQRTVTIRGMAFLDGDTVSLQRGEKIISAKNISVVSDTQITCIIPIPEDAEPGAWDVVVTSRYNKSDILRSGFTIYSSTSLILAGIEPGTGEQGQYLSAKIIGNNLENGSVITLTTEGDDPIISEAAQLVKPDELKTWLHIPSEAMPDLWDLNMKTPSGKTLSKPDAFKILYNNTPVITAIKPDRAPVGTDDLKIEVSGKNFGDGEYLNLNLTMNSTTIPVAGAISYKGDLITGYLSLPNGTEPGWYDLQVTRDAGRGKTSLKSEMFRVL